MKKQIGELITTLLPWIMVVAFSFLLASCGTVKEIPVETIDKIEYRDSLIYVHDTVEVQIPVEVVKEVLPALDTSYLQTSLAASVAYLDTTKRQIHHELEQRGTVKAVYDTIVKVEYVDRFITQEVPIEVEIIKYRRDALFWVLVGWALLCIAYAVIKIAIKP